jgi:SET domain-containing protein
MTTHGYYNHSENPNCIIQTEGNMNLIIAKRDINNGEELTVDYRLQPYLEQPKDWWKK